MSRVIIIGGGFAGVKCARVLRKSAPKDLEIVLFSRDNHMVFQPLLADVAGSSLNPRAVAAPLRQLLPGVQCRAEEVIEIDLAGNAVVHLGGDGQPRRLGYDHVVIACGNQVNLNLLPGMANHALPLKTVGDAIALRAHTMRMLEAADLAETEEERRAYLTYIVVGGGFSGVEVAGELNDLVRAALPHYPRLMHADVNVTLLHGQAQILPELSPHLRDYARMRMERAGVRVRCEAKVTEVTGLGATLDGGERIRGATVVCTVGTTATALIARLDVAKERGRIVVDADMRLAGRINAWAVGDCAIVVNAIDGKPAPPTAQFAEREGCQAAQNLVRVLRGEGTQAFSHQSVGAACGIGGRRGVAELYGVRISGFAAWWLWRSAFLAKLPSLLQKIKVGLDWAWELVFPRDLSHFRAATSSPVNEAYYAPGDVLFRRGQRLGHWFAIASGEADVVGHADDGSESIAMSLRAGDLAGAATLAELDEGAACVRARTAVTASLISDEALSHMSGVLKPVQTLLERGVARPRPNLWLHHPEALRVLAGRRAGDLPSQSALLRFGEDACLADVFTALIAQRAGCALITRELRLVGIATRTDLLAAFARGAGGATPISQCMNAKPYSIDVEHCSARAAELMVAKDFKYLPVCDGEGRVHNLLGAEDFIALTLLPAQPEVPQRAAAS